MTNQKTFVLVHGSWQGAWSWDDVRDRLRAHGHRVITPALPGRGDISEDRSWIGHDDNVAAVLAALDADGAGPVVLAGHSLGGVAVSQLAATRADRAIPMPWELWRANFIQTASEHLARESHRRLVPDPYRPVFEPIRLLRPVHRDLPATFLSFTHDQTMPPGFWHPGMSSRLNGVTVAEIDGDHEMPLTAPDRLADALQRLAATPS